MKKPHVETEEQQPRKIIRADKAPTNGYSLVVDGHFSRITTRSRPPKRRAWL